MEAIAQGYASDSSSCSSHDEEKQKTQKVLGKHESSSHRSSPSHLGLFANYDSDDSSGHSGIHKDTSLPTKTVCPTEHQSAASNGIGEEEEMRKRHSSHCLPLPILSSSQSHSSSLLFPKNYLVGKIQYNSLNNDPSLVEKLDRLYQNEITGGKSFAEHLKCQKEFGNPHLFPSIIEYFGIDEMESNIGKMDDCLGLLEESSPQENGQRHEKPRLKLNIENFEYMDRLLVKEEENRIRESQSS
mmetsp:Transcript_5935/g.11217  ORF Transcript_5935/g.11217 Transcript_5935/m.11217 type:complete len:243 (-) Transcript_5935:197-925(-)|eukprot:CAMPEP_0176503924 /NCGR_PEP_ID=MMETSP0200_2-20121128/15647_1 /TAXON_ID=947934 /ORGANISM="Chaetoceros sp., Strain GSL56" /LENGTH=242 /DNA_ID=CAMNT_0017903297 /DNA_START=118 /DNA_END=846 /DNA_ORIENTATION=-